MRQRLSHLSARLRTFVLHGPPVARGAVVVALVLLLAGPVALWLSRDATLAPPALVSVSPSGEAVPRLNPVVVTFSDAPHERDGARLISLEPATDGAFAWIDERTLLFQPAFPGFVRGTTYAVTVRADAAGLPRDHVQQFTVDGKLEVATVIPANGDGEVPAGAQVLVQFTRSVAPLTLLEAQDTSPVIEFDPPLPGSGEWLNTSLYRFTPDRFAPSTTYRARIAAGLSSAVDGVLEADFEWTFTTYRPALIASDPGPNTTFVGPNRPVILTFNQPMERASVESGFGLLAPDGAAVAGSIQWSEDDTVATFAPAERLALETRYDVVLQPGLRGREGGETPAERRFDFLTSGLPRVVRTDPAEGVTTGNRWGIHIQFNNPMDVESLESRIAITGIDADDMQFFSWEPQSLQIQAPLQPSTAYTLTIAAGATDRDGLPLAPFTLSFRTGEIASFVSFAVPGYLATYSSDAEPILYFHSVNRHSVQFALHPVTEAEARSILAVGHFPDQPNRWWTPSGPPLRRWTETLEIERDRLNLNSTSLGDGEPLPRGHYYVVATGGEHSARLLFSVVDTSIVVKTSLDELLVWAVDYATGEPLAGVPVTALGPGISSPASTDASGLASFAIPRPRELTNENRTYVVRIEAGGRFGVGTTLWTQGTDPWRAGIPFQWETQPYVGHLYTDRPIYRPGETVHYKAVARADDDAVYTLPHEAPPLVIVVRDPQGQELWRHDVTLNDLGTFAGEILLPSEASIGTYTMQFQYKDERQPWSWITYGAFTVAEFRRPEFEVTAQAARAHYIDGESIAVDTTASFYFGGALAGAPVSWTALASPTSIRVEDFERYSFTDFDRWRVATISEPLRGQGSATTGDDGTVRLEVPAALRGAEGTQAYQVSVTVTDENAQAVATSTSAIVHPASYYAGIRSREYIGVAGQPSDIDLVTADIEGNLVSGRPVTVLVYEREWVTTKEQTASGGARYRSEPRDTLVATLAATTGAGATASLVYTPAKAGLLRLVAEVTDERGRVARSAAYLWVAGTDYVPWRITNDDLVELVADKDRYEVGDVAEVLVPAPWQGAIGLVTLERGRVLSREVREFDTNSELLRIPITEAHLPNAFVSVVLYRAPTAEDPIPRYKVGYVELPVSTETRRLDVAITPNRDRAVPGESVRYDVRVTDHTGAGRQAEVSVAIVDKAVLALADEVGPDGLRAFWFQRGLSVMTSSSLAVSVDRTNDVIQDPEQGGKGGGSDPRLREAFRNTAYWEAQVLTDALGRASVEVPMPDNLTTWRAQARAISGDTMVGEGTSELLVTQPLIIRPALPRFLRVGDDATLRVLVRNGTSSASTVTVTLEANGVDVGGPLVRTTTIAADRSVTIEWPATVSRDGTARLVFRAAGTAGEDAVAIELPVYLDVTPETMATGGVVTGAAGAEAVYLPNFALRDGGRLEVGVQASITGVLADELAELALRPYEFDETADRTASRLLATLAIRRANGLVPLVTAEVERDVARLLSLRRSDGGWAWCARCIRSDEHITTYVLLALGEAQRAGREIDATVFLRGSSYLLPYINRRSDRANPADQGERAYMLYASVVGRSARAAASGFETDFDREAGMMRAILEQHRETISNWGRAYLVLGLLASGAQPSDAEVRTLLNDLSSRMISSANGNHWEDETGARGMHGNVRTTALVLQALVAADPRHPLIEETVRWLVVARSAQRWQHDVARAQALVALGAYATGTGELRGDFRYSVLLREQTVLDGRFAPQQGLNHDALQVPLTSLPLGEVSIVALLRDEGPGRLYYAMNLRYQTPATEIEALNRGFAVSHQYTLLGSPGQRVDRVALGDVVRVKVTVVTSADRKYVVLNDYLPAGLEPVDPQLKIVPIELKQQLERERREALAGEEDEPPYFAPWFYWYYNPWDQVDTRDDRVTIYASELPKGVHEFIYYARATTPGRYFVAPAHVEESFFPEVFGRSDSGRFEVLGATATVGAQR